MAFDTLKFLRDYSIQHTTNHHHCTEGRVQVHCPFCSGKSNYHLGLLLRAGHGSCWRCGGHPVTEVIKQLLNCSWSEVDKIKETYSDIYSSDKAERKEIVKIPFCFPFNTRKMNRKHREYLISRKFNSASLEREWGLMGTGYWGNDDANRIIIPIHLDREVVSYQGRSILKNHPVRYRTCPIDKEIVHHKHTLYGIDKLKDKLIVVVCEGVTDVWRLGEGSVATFGTGYTKQQINLLSQFEKVVLLFDKGEAAQRRANELGETLALLVDVEIAECDADDPAKLSDDDAYLLMREIREKLPF